MKKPVILLVDDDRAVLDALEAALVPAFEEIARVEAFDKPEEVLAALPRWTEERRSIAVAIVDQKMPGMTGVELLTRLRGEPPAAHLRSLLLTGYAGLDSALAAKNDAGVERYVEKPWAPSALLQTVRECYRSFLGDSSNDLVFVLKQVDGRDELAAILQLRREVYRTIPGLAEVLPPAGTTVDFDPYDAVSWIFALTAERGDERELVGTIRIAGQAQGPAAAVLENLAEMSGHQPANDATRPLAALPLLEYLIDAEAVRRLVERIRQDGERVAEPGRFVVMPSRRTVRGLPRLARHMIECTTASFIVLEIEHAVLTTFPEHRRLYEPLGFRQTEGTEERFHPDLNAVKVCLHGTRSWVPETIRPRVLTFEARYRQTGKFCLCASFPACLPEPYATNDFRRVDVFCPIRACEVATMTGAA